MPGPPAPIGCLAEVDHRPKTLVVGALCALVALTYVGLSPGQVAAASGAPALRLLSQSPWVGVNQPFTAHLSVSGVAASSSPALQVTVYPYLTTRSAFDQTLTTPPDGTPLSQSSALALSSLTADPTGGYDITVPVSTGAGGIPGAASTPYAADLDCSIGSCGGVYPVVFTLSDGPSPNALAELTTYLVYDDPAPDTQRLRLALVIPLALPSAASDRSGHLAPPSDKALGNLDTLVTGLATHPDVPLTVVPDPASAQAMAGDTRARARQTLATTSLVADEGARQAVCEGFTTVNPNALVADGLGSELADQVARAPAVLAGAGVHSAQCTGTGQTWVASGDVDAAAVTALQGLGYQSIVVPLSAVSGPTATTTFTRLFTFSPSRGAGAGAGLTAALTDPGLDAHLQDASGPGAALAAYQLLADLSLIYYEEPNTPSPRGVVALSPTGWTPNPGFLADALGGLEQNPVIEPLTLENFFTEVPVGGNVGGVAQPVLRRPAVGTIAAPSGLPTKAIRATRLDLEGFAAALAPSGSSGASSARSLQDLLLRAESDELKASQQQAALAGIGTQLANRLADISIRTDTIRLTSISATVPITVLRSTPYAVTGTLCLTSDKLLFPSGRCHRLVTLRNPTNSVSFAIRARASGDFRMTVTFSSPDGHLVLASGQLSVRSMSTSLVAIALSVAAVAVLLLWWGRTLWRGRRSGRGAHARRGRRGHHHDDHDATGEGGPIGPDTHVGDSGVDDSDVGDASQPVSSP
jgi:Family of unknown function (DUF6049)